MLAEVRSLDDARRLSAMSVSFAYNFEYGKVVDRTRTRDEAFDRQKKFADQNRDRALRDRKRRQDSN
jgi:hypothetical protein